ncbi:MAG: hypothetical protein KDD45_08195 [Bdellovibrionales bacterium]|nr:hypothetical protein [Bdellovibrionales bacterium]
MKVYISENINTSSDTDTSYMLSLIAKEVSNYTKMFLPEKKLIVKIKQNELFKKYNIGGIEVIEDMDKIKSIIEIKEKRLAKDILQVTLGNDFYEKFLEFIQVQKSSNKNKIDPYNYTLKILKITIGKQLSLVLENRLKFRNYK